MGMGVAAMAIAAAVAKIAKTKRGGSRPDRDSSLKILVVRPDRLGDVILSTPVFEAVKIEFPKAHLTAWVQEFVRPLIQGNPFVDEVVTWAAGPAKSRGFREALALAHVIRAGHFDVAVVLKTEPWIGWALVLAGVPIRIGPWSKPHSFLVYNRGLRQHRSRVEMHEADYNLQLLTRLGMDIVASKRFLTRVSLDDQVRGEAQHWLLAQGWQAGSALVLVHPGMGGSALNWPEEYYIALIRALVNEGRAVLVTGGAAEEALLSRFRAGLGELAPKVMFYGGKEARGIDYLAGLFSWASVVIAPSTGPLHVAVALAKPVVTFYPPIRVQSAERWGPYVGESSRAAVLVPKGFCGEKHKCRGTSCASDSCMRSLPVETALKYTREYL